MSIHLTSPQIIVEPHCIFEIVQNMKQDKPILDQTFTSNPDILPGLQIFNPYASAHLHCDYVANCYSKLSSEITTSLKLFLTQQKN